MRPGPGWSVATQRARVVGLSLLVALSVPDYAAAGEATRTAGMRRLAVAGIGAIFCAELDAAGRTVAVGDRAGNLALVSLGNNQTLWRIKAHRGETRTLAFDPDARRPWLYSGGEDGRVIAWDRRSGRRIKEVHRGDHPVRAVVAGQHLLAVATERSQIALIHHGEPKKQSLLRGHKARVRALALSPDGQWLASGDRKGQVRLWRLPSGKLRKAIAAHQLWVNALAFGPRSKRLASAGFEKRVRIWGVPGGKRLASYRGHVRRVADLSFHPDGQQLASACLDRTVGVWDLKKGRLSARLDGHRYQVSAVAYSPRGDFVLTASGDGYLRIWSTPPTVSPVLTRLSDPGPGEITLRNNTTGERVRLRLVDRKGKLLPAGRRALARVLRSMPDSAATPPNPKLAELLYKVADHFGRHHEVIFISGHRSLAYNNLRRKQSKQVARKSRHVTGEAMDLRIDGVTITALVAYLQQLKAGGVGYYPDSQFVHMDVGPPRSWGGN